MSTAIVAGGVLPGRGAAAAPPGEGKAVDLGSRRELLVDDHLFAGRDGVELKLHRPEPRDVVLVCDAPWEGNTSAYYTLFQDGERYRAYYRGWHFDERRKAPGHPEFTCYAESRDGIHFEKPELGLVEFAGSKKNNIILAGPSSHNFAPIKDDNPAASDDARYKALGRGDTMLGGKRKSCLYAYKSSDGIHWSRMTGEPVITAGAFDSQNVAFFDAQRGLYRAYWRIFSGGVRAIRTATSHDFLHWTDQADLKFPGSQPEHLYTNAIRPYFRAPPLLLGFPTRFNPANEQVEPVFMSSRDGVTFHRWPEAVIPITAPKDRGGNRSNYMAWGLLSLPSEPGKLSVYATEAYYAGLGSRLRRFVYRVDGFVSAHSRADGRLETVPLRFTGSKLTLNIASRGGSRLALWRADGRPLPGFTIDDCHPLRGDFIDEAVEWKGGSLERLAGQDVRIEFRLADADLYSFRFGV